MKSLKECLVNENYDVTDIADELEEIIKQSNFKIRFTIPEDEYIKNGKYEVDLITPIEDEDDTFVDILLKREGTKGIKGKK